MSGATARNIAIVLVLAAVVAFLPGGGEGAGLVGQIINAAFIVVLVVIVARLYTRFREDIYGLGERWRLVLYGAVATALLAFAAASALFAAGGGGALLFLLLVAGASYSLVLVWRRYRAYG